MHKKITIAGLALASLSVAACSDDTPSDDVETTVPGSDGSPTDTVSRSQTTAGNGRANEPGDTTTD